MLELLVCALVVWQTVEVYSHSALLAPVREYFDQFTGFVGQLHRCMWCLSVWVSFIALTVYRLVYGWHTSNPLFELLSIFGWGLAVSRLANLANDFFYDVCRTPLSGVSRNVIRE
jgi:hypothetical protein